VIWRRRTTEPSAANLSRGVGAPAPLDVLDQVRRLELRMQQLVNTQFAGEYRSVYKGQGMEFAEVREYQPGDEVRRIDWNVTARSQRPFVKLYVEERELSVLLVVDLSASGLFGTQRRFKSDVALEAAGVLALSALRNNDRVGLVAFTDRIEHALPASKGRRHGQRILRDLLMVDPVGRRTDFGVLLPHVARHLNHRALIFVLSDCRDPAAGMVLRELAALHEVVVLTTDDPAELTLPDVGLLSVVDPESGTQLEVDTSDAAFRARYATSAAAAIGARDRMLSRSGANTVALSTATTIVEPLLAFFRAKRGLRRGIA
jgi:uncharacterized protein (DUF58 family)